MKTKMPTLCIEDCFIWFFRVFSGAGRCKLPGFLNKKKMLSLLIFSQGFLTGWIFCKLYGKKATPEQNSATPMPKPRWFWRIWIQDYDGNKSQ